MDGTRAGATALQSSGAPPLGAGWIGTGAALAAIWVAVLLTGLFAQDFVSGSQQEHIHLAALQNWFWGAIASALVVAPLVALRRERNGPRGPWLALGAGTAAIWLIVTLLSVFGPVEVTGSDPTRIPIATILSPIVGTFGTGFLAVIVTVVGRQG